MEGHHSTFPSFSSSSSSFSFPPALHAAFQIRINSLHFHYPWKNSRLPKKCWDCLINPSKKIFAAPRFDIPDAWQMPQGGSDKEEHPRTYIMRELREETGVTPADIVAEVPYWLTYDIPPEVGEKLKQQWVQSSDWKG